MVLGTTTAAGTGTIGVSTTHTVVFNDLFHDATGGAGSLSKVDTGTLVLNSASSSYTGGTTVYSGTLFANNTSGSATGTGPVNAGDGATTTTGTFGGSGFVTGSIVINKNGVLAPGAFGGTSVANYRRWNADRRRQLNPSWCCQQHGRIDSDDYGD